MTSVITSLKYDVGPELVVQWHFKVNTGNLKIKNEYVIRIGSQIS